MHGVLWISERSQRPPAAGAARPPDPKQLNYPPNLGSRSRSAFYPLADQQEGNSSCCACAGRLLPCSLPRSAALRLRCRCSCRSGCSGCSLRCGASGCSCRACLGGLWARGRCCRCSGCSPLLRRSPLLRYTSRARGRRGCSLSRRCCSLCCSPRGRARPPRLRWRVAPSCLGRGWGPAARLRGVSGALRSCSRMGLRRRSGCGGEWRPECCSPSLIRARSPRPVLPAGLPAMMRPRAHWIKICNSPLDRRITP